MKCPPPKYVPMLIVCFSMLFTPEVRAQAFTAEPQNQLPMESRKPATEPVSVITIVGLILGIVGVGISLATLAGDKAGIGDGNLSVTDKSFHVTDTRTALLTVNVSYGSLHDNDTGAISFEQFDTDGRRKRWLLGAVTQGRDLGNRVRNYVLTFEIEGIAAGSQDLIVRLTLLGKNWDFFNTKDFKVLTELFSTTVGVEDPITGPFLVPDSPQTRPHPLSVVHALRMGNFAEKKFVAYQPGIGSGGPFAVLDSKVILPGVDFRETPTLTELASTEVKHSGEAHPNQTWEIPLRWGVLSYGGSTSVGQFKRHVGHMSASDFCSGGTQVGGSSTPMAGVMSPLPEGSGPRLSSGSRTTVIHALTPCGATGNLSGLIVRITNPVANQYYDVYTDVNGVIMWSNLLLEPVLTVTMNPGRTDSHFDETVYPDVPLTFLEDSTSFALVFTEALAPAVSGSIATDDGSNVRVLVLAKRQGCDEQLVSVLENGPFVIEALGAFLYDEGMGTLRLRPESAFNRTLASADDVIVQVNMSQPSTDVGTITFIMLPRSNSSTILFRGRFLDRRNGLPVSGLTIRAQGVSPTGLPFDITTSADMNGSFSLNVPNSAPHGPAIVSAPNARQLGYDDTGSPLSIDFGANGLDFLDIGTQELRPLNVACCFPDGSCSDVPRGDCASQSGTPGGSDDLCAGDADNNLIDDSCEPTSLCGDGACQVSEGPCSCQADCGMPPGTETVCTDGIDNDCDTLFDCQDANCWPIVDCCATIEEPWVLCDDGQDNDCDGHTDCADPDCADDPLCCVPSGGSEVSCADLTDNDCDGNVDCVDTDCAREAACARGVITIPTVSQWGLAFLGLLLVGMGSVVLRRRARATA